MRHHAPPPHYKILTHKECLESNCSDTLSCAYIEVVIMYLYGLERKERVHIVIDYSMCSRQPLMLVVFKMRLYMKKKRR